MAKFTSKIDAGEWLKLRDTSAEAYKAFERLGSSAFGLKQAASILETAEENAGVRVRGISKLENTLSHLKTELKKATKLLKDLEGQI